MKHKFPNLFTLCSCFALLFLTSGCFEVIEENEFRAGCAGKFSLTVNLSQSKTNLKTIMASDSLNGFKIPKPANIRKEMIRVKEVMNASPGVSGVEITDDFNNFIFTLSCDFESPEKMENAILNVARAYDKKNREMPENNFVCENNAAVRKAEYKVMGQFAKPPAQFKEALEKAVYRLIVRSAKPLASVGNQDFRLSKSGKAGMLSYSVFELLTGDKKVHYRLKYK